MPFCVLKDCFVSLSSRGLGLCLELCAVFLYACVWHLKGLGMLYVFFIVQIPWQWNLRLQVCLSPAWEARATLAGTALENIRGVRILSPRPGQPGKGLVRDRVYKRRGTVALGDTRGQVWYAVMSRRVKRCRMVGESQCNKAHEIPKQMSPTFLHWPEKTSTLLC